MEEGAPAEQLKTQDHDSSITYVHIRKKKSEQTIVFKGDLIKLLGGSKMALNGTYKIVSESQMGKTEATFHFKTDGNILTGTNEVMGQTLTIQDGKIDGNSFEFKEKMDSPMGASDFTFKGTIDGDQISGNIITQMGTTPFKGSRV